MEKWLAVAPWLVAWSGETETSLRHCPYAGGRLATWTVSAPGEGRPIFTRLHPVRLRQCIAQKLCGICGKATLPDDRWMLNRGEWTVAANGERRFVLRDFLLHKPCGEFAFDHCPWLRENAPVRVRAPDAFGVIATGRGASASDLLGTDHLPTHKGPVVERLWLTLSAGDAVKRFGKHIPPPPGLSRQQRRALRNG